MRPIWSGWLACGIAACALASVAAQVGSMDVEQVLSGRFGFTPAEVAAAGGGQPVVKMLPANDAADVGVFGAVRVTANAERLVDWIRDVSSFRKAAQLGLSRRLSDPPQIGDFADLSLDAGDLDALRACRPGKCGLRMGDRTIQRFQAEVDWAAPDAAQRATLLTRQLMLGHAQAYLKGGDQALGAYHNDKAPLALADEFHQALWQAKTLYGLAPEFAAYLEGFPAARLPGSEQFLYWAKSAVGPEASITLHQIIVYRAPGGGTLIADKQLYASRYVDAAVTVMTTAPARDGAGFYLLAGARARSSMLRGMGARLLRSRVETATRDTTRMYLDWIRQSLAM